MVGALIGMKLSALRHSLRDPERALLVVCATLIGLAAAGATIWIGTRAGNGGDLLAIALAVWTFSWIVGPVFSGGDESLRPEYFAMLPRSSWRKVTGLLAASATGIAPLVSLVALASIGVYAATQLGLVATLVAIPAMLLQLALLVLLARVTVAVFGLLLRSLAGAITGGIVNAFVMAFAAQGWAVVIALGRSGDLAGVAGPLRGLPSGWALAAVEAAGRGDFAAAAGILSALTALCGILLACWVVLLPLTTGARVRYGAARAPLPPAGRLMTAVRKELRSWTRDRLRVGMWTFAVAYGLFFCLFPLAVGFTAMMPFAGLVFATMAAATAANLYGVDGTALWATLLAPGAEKVDVRARQFGWLVAVGPVAAVLTIALTGAFTVLSGQTWAWPYVIALLPAVLGGGAGLVILVSVVILTPGTDPHKRGNNPLSIGQRNGENVGVVYLMLVSVPLSAAPAFLATWLGSWWGLPVGLATGTLWFWLFGLIAQRRLAARGPELLSLMRYGVSSQPVSGDGTQWQPIPAWKRLLVGLCAGFGAIPLIPQGVVPGIFLLTGGHVKSWFLALYLPSGWQWPAVVAMVGLGLTMYGTAATLYLRSHRSHATPAGSILRPRASVLTK
jgi:ABC-2 type transport system permease protein